MGNVNTEQKEQLRSANRATGLRIRLLGPLSIANGSETVVVASKKARALVGYLALRQGTEVSRSVLTGLLWGERSESQARASLRQTLSELRGFGSLRQSIVATKEAVAFVPGSAWIDAKVFESAAGSEDEGALREAAELIVGDLMEGLSPGEAGFEQWLTAERQRFRRLACTVYARLMELAEHGRRLEEALTWGLKLIALDPLGEHVHRALMRLYAAQGRYDAALAQYERCRRELSSELGVRPEAETEELARSIRASRRDGPAKSQVSVPDDAEPDHGKWSSLPDRPSIAVLPFANLDGNPEHQYFSDGITEDIITELSRFRQLHVFARNTSFRYRGKDVDALRIGRELGVAYLVDGSVRRLGDRIRITAQLIDAGTGHHVWAERFDRNQEELFAIQDRVVRTIVGTIVGRMQAAGAERARRKPPASLAAYECVLRGDSLPFESSEGTAEARRLFEKAIELDPGYARAYALLAAMTHREWLRDMTGSDSLLDQAFELAKKAVALDENDDLCHCELGWIYLLRRSFELAEHHHLKALGLNQNGSVVMASLGLMYVYLGETAHGMSFFQEAKLLNPFFDPTWYNPFLGAAHFIARRHDEAIAALSRSSAMSFSAQAYLAASYAMMDRIDDARRCAAEVLRLMPDFSLARFAAKEPLKHAVDRQHLIDGLRKAGLP